MYDDDRPSEIDKLIRAGMSGVGSAVRGVVLFLAAGVVYGASIGEIEQFFHEVPCISLGVWVLTGIFIFRACERGDI